MRDGKVWLFLPKVKALCAEHHAEHSQQVCFSTNPHFLVPSGRGRLLISSVTEKDAFHLRKAQMHQDFISERKSEGRSKHYIVKTVFGICW